MTPEQLAQIAYETYWTETSMRQYVNPWSKISLESKRAWLAAAQAVKASVLSDFSKVGEGESSV